jgi:hypothetical protein
MYTAFSVLYVITNNGTPPESYSKKIQNDHIQHKRPYPAQNDHIQHKMTIPRKN